jgi:beta-lactamase regulating signal transducer with metallopeptidase domain
VEILAESAIRVSVVALGVAVVLRVLRIRAPRAIHRAWTAVVVVMLVLPSFVAWGPAFPMPILPASAAPASLTPGAGDIAAAERGDTPTKTATVRAARSQSGITMVNAATAAYVVIAALFLWRVVIGVRRARAIRRDAVRVNGRLTHPSCVTPMTVGIIAPVVILPPEWPAWDGAELAAVLAHEEEHVRRRDPLFALIVLLNRAIFWFHPLAWWLAREIARLSEQACDATVISRGHDSDVYSASLLRFARLAAHAGGRIAPVVTTIPGAGLKARLAMLASPQAPRPSRSRLACAFVSGAVLVAICAAASPTRASAQASSSQTPGAPEWSVQMSDHFEIVHPGLPADRVSDAIREAEAAYAQLSAAFRYDMPRRVPIILVRRDGDLSALGPSSDVALQSGALSGQRIVLSLESLDRRTGIAVHELTHQFALEIIPGTSRVEPVLIEGLAEHQRGSWAVENLRVARAAVSTGAIPSAANLAAADRYWAHAVFDFVAAQYGEDGIRRLMFALRAHETMGQAVPMAFGVTIEQFNQAFRGYATRRFSQPG